MIMASRLQRSVDGKSQDFTDKERQKPNSCKKELIEIASMIAKDNLH